MPTVNAQGFIRKLTKLREMLPLTVAGAVRKVLEKVQNDLTLSKSMGQMMVPSWANARTSGGPNAGRPYFWSKDRSYLYVIGLDGMIDVHFDSKTGNVRGGFGKTSLLDLATSGSDTVPFWRIYEFGQGKKTGKSSTHRYVPGLGMVPRGNGPGHPGVTPVHIFAETEHYIKSKKMVQKQISKDITELMRNGKGV